MFIIHHSSFIISSSIIHRSSFLSWPQPIAPLHALALSALAAAIPLFVVLLFMGVLRKPGYVSAAWGLASAFVLAALVWRMPPQLALASAAFGFVYALWPIMWIVFAALWLYNLAVDTGKFDLLRRWMAEHGSGDPCIQAILVAFCFGALIEGTAGFGSPVAMAAFLLVGLGFSSRKAVTVSLIANTTPVAFGALGIPIVALAGVTGLDLAKLSSMVGRQLPFLSLLLPSYLVLVVAGRKGLRAAWPSAVVAGASFALAQFLVSNFWGPYVADVIASLVSIAALVLFLHWRKSRETQGRVSGFGVRDSRRKTPAGRFPASPEPLVPRPGFPLPIPNPESRIPSSSASPETRTPNPAGVQLAPLTGREAAAAWAPWVILSVTMIAWSYLKLFQVGRTAIAVPGLHQHVFISLYQKPYAAIYSFEPLAAGTGALTATLLTALAFLTPLRVWSRSGWKTLRQLRMPGLTVGLIVALAYLYNYSGMAYTLGAALAGLGALFPLASGFLGWVACFLSGSDTASNLLFGNLQVAAAHQIGVNPILLAATNSSGAVTGKMISPQNIAVGVTTVGLVGQEGDVLRTTFWHSILLAAGLSVLAFAQAYWLKWMTP
ncbi:MAG: L-lactate permease [Terriglobia bacterium]